MDREEQDTWLAKKEELRIQIREVSFLRVVSLPSPFPFRCFSLSSFSHPPRKERSADPRFSLLPFPLQLKTKEPLLQADLASLRKQKIDLDSASSGVGNSNTFPTPTSFASNTNGNGNGSYDDRSRSNSVVVQQQQQRVEEESATVGDGMMDVEGDEDVEY